VSAVLRWLRGSWPLVIGLAMLAGLGCWKLAQDPAPHSVPARTAAVRNTAALSGPGITAESIRSSLAAVLADQRQADQDHREAWIADGYSSDLSVLADVTNQAGGTSALDTDARRFTTDAQDYLDAAGLTAVSPPPGWQVPYAQLRADLNALAADTGLPGVPASRGTISGAAGTADPPVPVPVPSANACSSATTITNSSSDTGASSHSVKTKTTCGTGSVTVTRKHAVTATGRESNTTTTATASGAGGTSSGSG
jgi:hypothetical protein